MDSKMASMEQDQMEEMNSIMIDLQHHLNTANLQLSNLSTIAQKGDQKLVEKFLSETVFIRSEGEARLVESQTDVLQSQLYVACFWGFKDVVRGILNLARDQAIPVEVNHQNKVTLWTPLHAATFQEHGPVIMTLLDHEADPHIRDCEDRTPADFASASDKIWGHFAALGLQKTPRGALVDMGIIKKVEAVEPSPVSSPRDVVSPRGVVSPREPGAGIRMAAYDRPESAYAYNSDPFIQAAVTGDVLANDAPPHQAATPAPQFSIYK